MAMHHRFLTCFLLLTMTAAAAESTAKGPNVILMMADDLGYGDISCYGSKLNRTPVLDRLAAEGIRLTDYHSGSTVCTPSRMALLSGYYPRRVGWPGGVLGFKMNMKGGMASEVRTIAEVFRDAGYRTGIVGKWHLGDHPDRLPRGQGFEESFIIKASNNQTNELWRDGELASKPFDNRLLTECFTDEAMSFIRKHHKEPFFLYLPFTAPHFPVQAHPEWAGKSGNAAFGDVVEELDHRVGMLLDLLKQLEIADNTLIVFTSDNGPESNSKNKTTAEPLRGKKWTSLEGGTRVPCIIHWPAKLKKGTSYNSLAASIDMLPTLADACGIPWQPAADAPPLDGMSLWPSLIGQTESPTRQELILWDGWAHPHAIRSGTWKLFIEETEWVEGSEQGPILFQLADDISESRNVAAEHPQQVELMTRRAREILQTLEKPAIPLGGGLDPEFNPPVPRWLR